MTDLIGFAVVHASLIQSLLFVCVIVGCWCLEAAALGHGHHRKRRRAGINAWFVAFALPIQLGMTTLCIALATYLTGHHWGLLHVMPFRDSPWIKYGLMFVALDFLDYVYHYAMHHIPLFWRFHLVHHTDQAIDASTTVREHPGETVLRNAFLIVWVVICGASVEILVLRQSVETVANILAHTSFRLRAGSARALGWLLITPNLHHVHHHSMQPYTDSNYGDVFSVWDRMFGTFANLAAAELNFGLDTHMAKPGDANLADAGIRRALAMPFASRTDARAA